MICIVGVDFSQVQSYISNSRKLSDIWAGSYIASYLSWCLANNIIGDLEERVKCGNICENCIITPTLENNLFHAIRKNGIDQEIRKRLNAILELQRLYPIFPARLTFITECKEKNELKNYILDKLHECYRKLIPYNELKNYIEKLDKYKFTSYTPIEPYISVVELEEYNSIIDVCKLISDLKNPKNEDFQKMLFEKLKKLSEEMQFKKLKVITPEAYLDIDELVKDIDSGKIRLNDIRGYKYCEMCNKLPAIAEDSEDYLCGWCLIKRKFGVYIWAKLGGFPSTSDMAWFDYKINKSLEITQEERSAHIKKLFEIIFKVNEIKLPNYTLFELDEKEIMRRYADYPTSYAIIKADMDSFGKLLLLEPEFIKFKDEDLQKEYTKKWKSLLPQGGAIKIIKEIEREINELVIEDLESIFKNHAIPIYIGGDDLLAIAPTDKALELAIKLRKNLLKFKTLKYNGRSICIVLSHFKYPLKISLEILERAIKYLKDVLVYKFADLEVMKDSLIVVNNERGILSEAIIPFRYIIDLDNPEKNEVASLLDVAQKIILSVRKGIYSRSLIYDLGARKEFFTSLSKVSENTVSKLFMKIMEDNKKNKDISCLEQADYETIAKFSKIKVNNRSVIEDFIKLLGWFS
ncbi:type III-B CRISPR-associated protein Cas10/Cmr2 [Saccharolobus caldissimus]|uniref:Type III-B CRISPR-associated protein Cas10/Cmr2 n=1 Tax=Saccharolobus caldissimus TaxID=1702097 RepID=A0AAQ4CSB1_9CREN|nr:type III-B CRISPR-associated protein Cas10/Cmr2 [Saccharolobus caldissimus]BDB98692.1 hypothetical protein SACC_17090 [Saccharolobus caldissimus]